MLNPKSGKVRQMDCRAEIKLGRCVESHLIRPWHSEKGLLCEKDYQKEICHICTYEWGNQCISEYMFDCWISTF